jgi:tetratricopeptide (TPR) repeat protein
MMYLTRFIFICLFLPVWFVAGQNNLRSDSLELLLKKETDPSRKVELMMSISGANLTNNIDKSLAVSIQAYQFAEEHGLPDDLIHAELNLAKVYYLRSDLSKAMMYAENARRFAESKGMELELALSHDAIGVIYYDIGNQNKCSEHFYASLKIYEKLNLQDGTAATYCRIGTLYLDQKEFEKAADYYSRSIQIAREIRHDEGIASNLHNLAKVYYQQKDYAKALSTFEEALAINKKAGRKYLMASNYLSIAEVYTDQHHYNEAIYNIKMARPIFLSMGNKLRLAKCDLMLSKIYYEQGDYRKSDTMAVSSLRLGLNHGYKDMIVASAEFLTKSFLSRRDSVTAFRYFIIEKQYKDSLFLAEKQKTLKKYELQEQMEKNDHELKIARQRRNLVILIISGCLLFSIIIILLILKQLRMKTRQAALEKSTYEKELEFKNKELILNVMSLMKKNEFLTDISEKLIKLEQESSSPESKNTIRKVAGELQKSQDEEIWKEFSIRFKEVHGDFYNRLLASFPTLTPNELKLCAFLRLNMSSKDIGELTGQSVSTLETARYRLRQKLGIVNSNVNLVTFLSGF